jgi:hypothetical protein
VAPVRRRIRPDTATIAETLEMCLSPEIADPVKNHLQTYFGVSGTHITGLRASSVKLPNNEESWPVVEWREGLETDVLAVYKVIAQGGPCGYLLHYGTGSGWLDRKRWRRSFLSWQVANINDLRDLFVVVQHVLGMLHWSAGGVPSLFLDDVPLERKVEEYHSPALTD